MNVITEPNVYLVGRQVVVHRDRDDDMDAFQKDERIKDWSSDTIYPSQELTEIAGRLCYMSFKSPRPGGNKAYLEHIKDVGHGCYDAETDVLTLSGWKAWPDVLPSDRLATLNQETGLVEYHAPVRLIHYHHKGRMYRVDSQQVDLLVTPCHKMFVCKTTTLTGRKKQDYELIKAEDLGHVSHAYMKSCVGSGKGWWTNGPGRDVFALLGFAIGDGYVNSYGSRQIRFHLRRERKISWLKSLCQRLSEKGFSFSEGGNDRYNVTLPERDHLTGLIERLFLGMYDENREKKIPWQDSLFTGASQDELEGLFEGLMQSDGHHGRTGDGFDTTSPHLPGQFQQLCLHIGLASNLCYVYGPEDRPGSYGTKPLTRMSVVRRCLKPEVNKWTGSEGKTYWVEDWEGDVFCAEVPNNVLYVRRNGKPVWSGNSVLEHAVWNFIFTGVSRSLTHELVRHRAGMSYSMLSQRYVDESVAEYMCPDIIASDPELYDIWLETVQRSHDAYVLLSNKLNEKLQHRWGPCNNANCRDGWQADQLPMVYIVCPTCKCDPTKAFYASNLAAAFLPPDADKTTIRKTARQAARSVLPNATETKIFVTMNARAARHFLEQRGSRHAEPEIRKLANKLLKILQAEAPNIFGDYQQTELPDGTHEITTPTPKV